MNVDDIWWMNLTRVIANCLATRIRWIKRFGDLNACMRVNEKWGEIAQKRLMSWPLGSMCQPEKVMSRHILKRVWKFSKINSMCRPIQTWVDTYWTNFEKLKKLFLCADLYEICVDTWGPKIGNFDTCEV